VENRQQTVSCGLCECELATVGLVDCLSGWATDSLACATTTYLLQRVLAFPIVGSTPLEQSWRGPQGGRHQFYIVSYDLLGRITDAAARLNFRVVVLDECHYIKNPEVKVY